MDASGCIVAPGAIDLHTHYDAQLSWDPYASLSGWFGVTSLTIGQCGFGFAPTRPEDRDLNMRMMNRIEAIPLESMRQGMRWDWETFPQYMDSLDRQGLGVNVGALVPFSPLRGYVLGMIPARERTSVTEAELNQMKQALYEGMKAGAFGFSADQNMEDRPEDGSLLPSHVASNQEFLALAEVLGEFGVGHMGWTIGLGHTPEERKQQRDLLAQMVRISGRPLHVGVGDPESMGWLREARAEGLPILNQQLAIAIQAEFTLAEYNLFDYMSSWVQPLVGSAEDRLIKLRDPSIREAMKQDVVEWPHPRTDWTTMRVLEVVHERNHKYEGLTIQEVAAIDGKHPLDAFLDLAVDEQLRDGLQPLRRNPRRASPGGGHQGPIHPHLPVRRRSPHPLPGHQHLAGVLPGPLGAGQGHHEPGGSPLQDQRPPGLVRRLQGPGHLAGRGLGRRYCLRHGLPGVPVREARVCH